MTKTQVATSLSLIGVICLSTVASAQTLTRVRPDSPDTVTKNKCDPAAVQCAAVYLDGAIRTADKSGEAAATTGSLGINLARGRWQFVTQINIVAATDTIREAPGKSLLVPGSGGFRNGLLEGRAKLWKSSFFARGYYSLSSFTWELPAMAGLAVTPVAANILGSGVGVVWQLADGRVENLDNSHLHVELNAGVMNRTLRGDVADPALTLRRSDFMGVQSLTYTGLEWGMAISYNDLRASINYYTFPRASAVRGFTRGQAVAGFAISTSIIEGALKK